MDIVPHADLPGASFDFQDARRLFVDAAAHMNDDQMLFMDGFSLQDAMAAFEIGEPRLDSGYIPADDLRPKFSPLAPLLPEELCWIIDRAFSYEMEWHNGNFMPHTVLTFLYNHHLDSIDPELIHPESLSTFDDPYRPPELITVVLRAAVAGLLKCCDLTWRELSKGAVQDTEDWQSDKCEIYLLEGTPVRVVTAMLEEASVWVSHTPKVPYQWKDPLISRLQLRKTFLQLLDTNIHRSPAQFKSHITICQEFLRKLLSQVKSIPEPHPDSVARLAFDPYISRRLSTAVPIRVLPVAPSEDTWRAWEMFCEGLKETARLASSHCLTTWKVVGLLKVWTAKSPIQQPYVRSLTESAFYDGLLIFDNYPFVWLTDKFFHETIGITWSDFQAQVNQLWVGSSVPAFDLLERDIHKLMIPYIRGNWNNPPRRRRQLMKTLLGWHHLYDVMSEMIRYVDVSDLPPTNLLSSAPILVLLWRLQSIREIVFSGFQLELYAPEERTFAYWYLGRVVCALEVECCEKLISGMPIYAQAYKEMVFNRQFAIALRSLCSSLFIMTLPLLSFNWNRTRPNFFRRYKWAFKSDYNEGERFETLPVGHPDLVQFMRDCLGALKDEKVDPREGIENAIGVLRDLVGAPAAKGAGLDGVVVEGSGGGVQQSQLGGWVDGWVDERLEFIKGLISISEGLLTTLPPLKSTLKQTSTSSPEPPQGSYPLHPSSSSSSATSPPTAAASVSTTSTLVTADGVDGDTDTEVELTLRLGVGVNASADTEANMNGVQDNTDGERVVFVATSAKDIPLRWDVDVHPWFPLPAVNRMDMN